MDQLQWGGWRQVSVNGEETSSSPQETDLVADTPWTTADTKYHITGSSDTDPDDGSQKAIQNPPKVIAIVSETYTTKELVTTDIPINEELISVNEEERLRTTDPSTETPESSMDRVTRKPIFSLSSSRSINSSREDVTDSVNNEAKVLDKREEVWMFQPDRNTKLKVLREEERFEVRSHCSETTPGKLYGDSDGEDDGMATERSPEKVSELEKERRDIIKKQGQRRSLDVDNLLSFQDGTDSPLSNIDKNDTSSEGPTTTEINTEQINFEAARQQFVMLEKKRKSLPITPRPQARPLWRSSQSLNENDGYSEIIKQKDAFILPQEVQTYRSEPPVPQEVNGRERSSSLLRKQFFRDLSVDTVDTENQEKPSEVYKGDISQTVPEVVPEVNDSIPTPCDETPIEREIRLALEREENLRRERGIQHPVESNEMVEIQKNPVLFVSPETQESKKTKDRSRTSLYLKREIEKEAQREADLKNEGKVVGLYDKGNAKELDERKKLFELPDELPAQKVAIKTTSKEFTNETLDNIHQVDSRQDSDQTAVTAVDAPLPYSVRTNWKPTPSNAYRTRRLSADNILDVKMPAESTTAQSTVEEALVLSKENIQVQPLKSRLHAQEDRIEEGKDDMLKNDQELANPVEMYSAKLKPSHSSVIEEEIRQTLERDRELQEQRRKSDLPPLSIPLDSQQTTQREGYNQYGRPSVTTDVSKPWSPTPWRSTPPSPSPYITTPVQMFKPRQYPKFAFTESNASSLKRHENWYAGIGPSDVVNTQIVESTRVSRHKSTMALRWEAGLFANEPSD
ncbi:mitotic interactor and substrate of PLK1 isoform X2 [Hyperolius riggenbachi]|uniref:mitotic interactor and substrate of PLK1 isoform X2 n=1 Tax=Hyperolius riggenbachi TaxID=752182 RepID=UPI0035A2D310